MGSRGIGRLRWHERRGPRGDGAWDLEGWDAAAKLVILVNAVLGVDARIEDVVSTGVASVPLEELMAAKARE